MKSLGEMNRKILNFQKLDKEKDVKVITFNHYRDDLYHQLFYENKGLETIQHS